MTEALAKIQPAALAIDESDPRTMIAVVRNRLAAVRELLKSELKGPSAKNPEGVDYGIVPGTKKLTLLQPGAEKIALMFQFVPSYTIQRTELPGGHLEVLALCTLTHGHTGRIVGQAEGSASTMESKHRYRGAAGKACPECGALACIPSKREFGGGYFCKEAGGGCGRKFRPGTPECDALDAQPNLKAENLDPADQRNTVTKIAQKRAFVSAVKGACAASEIFTVDIEDGDGGEQEPARDPIQDPQPRQERAPAGAGRHDTKTVTGKVEAVVEKPTKGGTRYGIKLGDAWYNTFDRAIGEAARTLKGAGVTIEYTTNDAGFRDVVSIAPADPISFPAADTAPQAQAQAQVEPEPPAHKENPRKPAASDQIGEAGAAHLAKLLDPVPVRLVVQYLEHNGSLPKGQPLVTLHRDIAAQIANDPAGTRSAISKWLDGQLPG